MKLEHPLCIFYSSIGISVFVRVKWGQYMDIDYLYIRKIKNGDTQAGERLIRKYYPEILRYCYLHIPDRGYAEDMTQETFVCFFDSLKRYDHQGKTRNYLYTIAANLCRNYYKKIKELPMDDVTEQKVEPIPKVETKLDIYAALNQLPLELKEVTILYFFRDRTQKEIASILNISPTLVRRRLERSKQHLREFLEKEERG